MKQYKQAGGVTVDADCGAVDLQAKVTQLELDLRNVRSSAPFCTLPIAHVYVFA